MLKISILDTPAQCQLIVEGNLIAPWVTELKNISKTVAADLAERELVIDIGNLTVISQEGENALLDLMRNGARFRCRGVFARHIVQQLVRRYKRARDRSPANSTDVRKGRGQR